VIRTGTALSDTFAKYVLPTFTSFFFMTVLLVLSASP